MMRAEITHLPMFDEYAFIEQHGQELTSDELEVLSERIDNLDRHIIAFNDAAIDMLHRAISDRAFEEGSVVAANLLELLCILRIKAVVAASEKLPPLSALKIKSSALGRFGRTFSKTSIACCDR